MLLWRSRLKRALTEAMETEDRFDLPANSACAEAGVDYVAAVDLLLSADTGIEEQRGPDQPSFKRHRW